MWSKLKLALWRSSRSESASEHVTDLPPDLAALGQELSRQAADLEALYPAGPAPRWVAAKTIDRGTASLEADIPAFALARTWRTLRRRWAAAMGASLLAAALVGAWMLSPSYQSAGEHKPSGPRAFARGGTPLPQADHEEAAANPAAAVGVQPAALAPKRAIPGTSPGETLLTTRGIGAAVDGHARKSADTASPRPKMPAHLFESLSRPEQEAVLDLLDEATLAEDTLDL